MYNVVVRRTQVFDFCSRVFSINVTILALNLAITDCTIKEHVRIY